jgi:hypothetical protein
MCPPSSPAAAGAGASAAGASAHARAPARAAAAPAASALSDLSTRLETLLKRSRSAESGGAAGAPSFFTVQGPAPKRRAPPGAPSKAPSPARGAGSGSESEGEWGGEEAGEEAASRLEAPRRAPSPAPFFADSSDGSDGEGAEVSPAHFPDAYAPAPARQAPLDLEE